jgi:hypothetical protein
MFHHPYRDYPNGSDQCFNFLCPRAQIYSFRFQNNYTAHAFPFGMGFEKAFFPQSLQDCAYRILKMQSETLKLEVFCYGITQIGDNVWYGGHSHCHVHSHPGQ